MTEGPFLRNHWSVVASGTLRAASWSVLIPVVMLASYGTFTIERALLMIGAFTAASAVANIIIWRRTKYYFLEDEMTVERNTVFRSETRIQYDRLASVNEERDPVCRLLGAVRLSFNLNSSVNASKAEAFIVLKADDAAALRTRMDSRIFGRPAPSEDVAAEEPASLVDVSFADILLHSMFGMPSAQVGVGAVTLAYSLFTFFGLGTPSIAATLLFVVDFLLPAVSSFLRLYGYRITRSGDKVSVSSGLLSTREDSFLLSKVNCVRVREPFLCRLMGRAILEVEVVGTANGKGVPLLCPLKRRSVAMDLFHSLLPEFECSAEPMGQCRVASAGILLKAGIVAFALLAAACLIVTYEPAADPEVVAGVALFGVLLCTFWAVMAYRTRAFACDGDIAMLVVGACDRITDHILMDKVQFADVRSSPIQRRKGAASCRISMLSTSGATSVTSGVFPAEELEKVSSTVLARIKDGRYDFRRFQRRPADGTWPNRLYLYRRTNFNRSAFRIRNIWRNKNGHGKHTCHHPKGRNQKREGQGRAVQQHRRGQGHLRRRQEQPGAQGNG